MESHRVLALAIVATGIILYLWIHSTYRSQRKGEFTMQTSSELTQNQIQHTTVSYLFYWPTDTVPEDKPGVQWVPLKEGVQYLTEWDGESGVHVTVTKVSNSARNVQLLPVVARASGVRWIPSYALKIQDLISVPRGE